MVTNQPDPYDPLLSILLNQYLSTTSILREITSLPVEQLIKSTNNGIYVGNQGSLPQSRDDYIIILV